MSTLFFTALVALVASLVAVVGRRPAVTIPGSTAAAGAWVTTAGMFFALGHAALTVISLALMGGFVVYAMVEGEAVEARQRERDRVTPPVPTGRRAKAIGSAR